MVSDAGLQANQAEAIARAICKSMNINPDGFADAHKFHASQDLIANGSMWTLRNWEAVEHVALAVIGVLEAKNPTKSISDARACA